MLFRSGLLGEHLGLRASLGFAALGSAALALLGWQLAAIRGARTLPSAAPMPATEPAGA